MRTKKEQLEQLKLAVQEATRKGEYEKAAQLQYGELPKLEAEIKQLSAQMDGKQSRMLKEEVDEEDVAKIVSKWTGIPGVEDAGRRSAEARHHGRPFARAGSRSG